MNITVKNLMHMPGAAAKEFYEIFGEQASLKQIMDYALNTKKEKKKSFDEIIRWAHRFLTFTDEDERLFNSYFHIVDSTCVDSENITHSKKVLYSRDITDSSNIVHCEAVQNSFNITASSVINDCSCVSHSNSCTSCEMISDSDFIINSTSIEESLMIEESNGVFGSKNIQNSNFIRNCENLSNCLFCYGLNDEEYCIFNKKVGKTFYDAAIKQMQMVFKGPLPILIQQNEYGQFQKNIDPRTYFDEQSELFWKWAQRLPNFDRDILFSITMNLKAMS